MVLKQVHISKIRPCEADVDQDSLIVRMISPGSRRSEQRQEESRQSSLQRTPSVPLAFRTSSAEEDEPAKKTTIAWAHARYRANIPWNQTLCFPRSQFVERLTLRCTEGGAPADQVCRFASLHCSRTSCFIALTFCCGPFIMSWLDLRVTRNATWAPHAWTWLRLVSV